MISSKEELEAAVEHYGILPFFANNIPGFSVEELVAPGMLFAGAGGEGAWEWKGPVIRRRRVAYGKLFKRKAGFIALNLLPDFLNFRRSYMPLRRTEAIDAILAMLSVDGCMSSLEMRRQLFGTGKRSEFDPVDITDLPPERPRRGILEPALQHLQMSGEVLIADFRYKQNRTGNNYGWGVALYSTPEEIFDADIRSCHRTAKDSLEYIIDHVSQNIATTRSIAPGRNSTELHAALRKLLL